MIIALLLKLWEMIAPRLPGLVQMVAGKIDKKLPGKKKRKLKASEAELLKYLVNKRYNQKKFRLNEIDRYSREAGVGLACYVKRAIDKVKARPSLMPGDLIKDFTRQSHAECAKGLCNTIDRYIYMQVVGVNLPSFEDAYIRWVSLRLITEDSDGNFCWINDDSEKRGLPSKLITMYMRNPDYKEITEGEAVDEQEMIDFFAKNKGERLALFRKGNRTRSTHTYLVGKVGKRLIMFDTWHAHYTGKEVKTRHPKPDKLWFVYYY